MKNNIIRFTVGFLTFFFLISSISVYGESIKKNIEVFYDNIKIVIDGVQITPKDSKGNTVEPFVYNGTTYLPVRAVSEALGKKVTWDGENKKVYLDEAEVIEKELKEVYLYNNPYVATNAVYWLRAEDNNWNAVPLKDIYFNRVTAGDNKIGDKYVKEYYVIYALNGQARNLLGRIGPYNNSGDPGVEAVFTFANENGDILFKSEPMQSGDDWIDINLNVENDLQVMLKVTISNAKNYGNISPSFSDIRVFTTDY